MKRLLIILSICLMTGCSLWVANYDTNEYILVNRIRTIAQTNKNCDENTVKNLYFTAKELNNFSQYLPRNQQSADLNKQLLALVMELYDKEPPIGIVYCKAKLNIIEQSAEEIQKIIGNKPR